MATVAPSIRPATRDDVPGIVALIGRVFGEYGFVYEPAVEVPDLLAFDAHYAPPHGGFWVVTAGGRVVGSAGVERLADGLAELHRLYLDADRRGQKLGEALVAAALDWCRAHGVTRLCLWSDTRFEHSHRLYRRLGFRQDGERVVPGDLNDSREYRFERDVVS